MRRQILILAAITAGAHMYATDLSAQDSGQDNAAAETQTHDNSWSWDERPAAAEIRRDTPSGLPVPRFISLKTGKTFCRAGPSFSHPVRITFMRKGLPLVVVAETHDHWRKLRDVDGDECWAHKSKLSSAKTALITTDGLTLHIRPDTQAPARARLGRDVVARIEEVNDAWARISAGNMKGWVRKSGLWGALPDHTFAAPHN